MRFPFRWVTAPLLVVLACAMPLAPLAYGQSAVAPNQPAPLLRGTNLDGQAVRVDWGTSKLTLVNFWATWCEPCRTEMPRIQATLDRRGADGLRVVGVAQDRKTPPETIAIHAAQIGVAYEILLGREKISRMWGGVSVLPTSFLIDDRGIVLRRYVGGADEVVDVMLSDIDAALNGRELSPPYVPPRAEPDDPAGG